MIAARFHPDDERAVMAANRPRLLAMIENEIKPALSILTAPNNIPSRKDAPDGKR